MNKNLLVLFTLIASVFFSKVHGQIVGPANICIGSDVLFVDTIGGGLGTWSCTSISISTISSSGTVTAVSAGSDTIYYKAVVSGDTVTDTKVIIVDALLPSGLISTIAGTGVSGFSGDSGLATAAYINSNSIATDRYGNIYLAEFANNRIRKISTSGVITTIGGTGLAVSDGDDGAATSAGIFGPTGIAIDTSGNIYIAEQGGPKVRKINSLGIISTFAGSTPGYFGDGGAATAAGLWAPSGLAFDTLGNLYIADFGSNAIRKVNTSGIISTYAGTGVAGFSGDGGLATSAELNFSYWICFDRLGNLYISDVANSRVRKVNASGIISTIAGNGTATFSGDGGLATSASLNNQGGIIADAFGDIYICDQYNNRIRKIDASGIITTIAGTGIEGYTGDGGPATSAELKLPSNIAMDNYGNLLINDQYKVRKVLNVAGTISGDTSVCIGATTTLIDTMNSSLSTWSTSAPSIATVDSFGMITGISAGITSISYIISNACGSAYVTKAITVDPLPVAGVVTGISSLCVGSMAVLADTVSDGLWSTITPSKATIDSTGSIAALATGTAVINYTVTNGCGSSVASFSILVDSLLNVDSIHGPADVCVGSSLLLVDTSLGGAGLWSNDDSSFANVDITGEVIGIAAGTAIIYYTVNNSCGASTAAFSVDIHALPDGGIITGATNLCIDSVTQLSDSVTGGAWTTMNAALASISDAGFVTGISEGIDTINYIVTNSFCTSIAQSILSIDSCTSTLVPSYKNEEERLNIYPNPTTGDFTFEVSAPSSEKISVSIINVYGQKIKEFDTITNIYSKVDLKGLEEGIYYVTTATKSQKVTEKILLVR